MAMDFARIRENLARVRGEIARIQEVEGLTGPVRIIAITKGHSVDAIRAASTVGLADIGENRIQEALEKRAVVADSSVRWHLVGHLQSNKAKHVPGAFAVVHSVHSQKLAHALARAWRVAPRTDANGGALDVLLQVNVAGESQKSGCTPDQVEELAYQIMELPELQLVGLMTMAPFDDDERVQRETFGSLRRLRECLAAGGLRLPELSMGMSSDFRAAVAEGATMVRLGTALFGERLR